MGAIKFLKHIILEFLKNFKVNIQNDPIERSEDIAGSVFCAEAKDVPNNFIQRRGYDDYF